MERWTISMNLRVSLAVYGGSLCAALSLLGLYRHPEGVSFEAFFVHSVVGRFCIGVAVGIVLALIVLARTLFATSHTHSKEVWLSLVMSLLSVVLLVVTLEVFLRLVAVNTRSGPAVGNKLLLPRRWSEFLPYWQTIASRTVERNTFLVSDETLGWTVNPNRRSENGLYLSSAEGLRSAKQGAVLRKELGDCRIALVGDSFTFGDDVLYEETWAHKLEQSLPSGCRVLNFGVTGYGIDQMYLRYVKDVVAWRPDVVILGFIDHDLVRSMSLYGFLLFQMSDMPFSKPRFVVEGERPEVINYPLISMQEILTKKSIQDLPHIMLEQAYRPKQWDRPGWEIVSRSFLFRFLTALYPLWDEERTEVSHASIASVNGALLRSFVEAVRKNGAQPFFVYLPSDADFPAPRHDLTSGLKLLQEIDVEYQNLVPCLSEIAADDRFLPLDKGGHYTPTANVALAKCFQPTVREMLRVRLSRLGSAPHID